MSKKLSKWLDEFVDNGADASNVAEWPENAGGGSGNWILKQIDTADKTFAINYQPIIDLLDQNGYDTNLSLGELQEQDLPFVHYPLTCVYNWGTTLNIEIGSTYAINITGGGFNLDISVHDSTTPLKDIFANAPKTTETDSGGSSDTYLLPWFDITPVNE